MMMMMMMMMMMTMTTTTLSFCAIGFHSCRCLAGFLPERESSHMLIDVVSSFEPRVLDLFCLVSGWDIIGMVCAAQDSGSP